MRTQYQLRQNFEWMASQSNGGSVSSITILQHGPLSLLFLLHFRQMQLAFFHMILITSK